MSARLRKLHLDGVEYTWQATIRSTAATGRFIRVRVFASAFADPARVALGKNGCALQADLRSTTDDYPYPDAETIRTLIHHALATGWNPATKGGTYFEG